MTEHTPGPWHVHRVKQGVVLNKDNDIVATVGGNINGSPGANARLIAAAPKLLEMLEVYANKNCSWGYSESQGAHTGNIWTCPEEECAPAREAIKEAT